MADSQYRTAFVTGASSGIGAALCKRLAFEGVEVALAARREEQLEQLASEIRECGGKARVYALDVTEPEVTIAALRQADDEMEGIDLVVANAGMGSERWLGKLTWDEAKALLDVNVNGAVATLIALVPRMIERKRGHLVGVSSLAQYRGLPRNGIYSASKSFVANFLEGLRVDLRSTGVAVTDVRPGFVRTPMTDKNNFHMPFLVEADDAAEIIWNGIRKKDALIAFPWQLAALVRSTLILPPAVWDRAVTRARGDG